MRGLTYVLRNTLYVSLTNRVNAVSLVASRGPSFTMPASSGFAPLEAEPSAADVLDAVSASLTPEVAEVCFAGAGEPLLRRRVLEDSARQISSSHGHLRLRLNTNGLVPKSEAASTAAALRAAGFEAASIALATADNAQYAELMRPEPIRLSPAFSLALGHAEVVAFASACIDAGLAIECAAVAAPGVDVEAVEALARSLGATFRCRSWHP